MTILDRFERRTIECHNEETGGIYRTPSWCYGEFFIHNSTRMDGKEVWIIGSIPRGMMFPLHLLGVYTTVEAAATVVLEMSKIKNNWSGLDAFDKAESIQLMTLALLHGAKLPERRKQDHGNMPFLNGHRAEDYR